VKIRYRYAYLPEQIAKLVTCRPHSLHKKFVDFLESKEIKCVESYTDYVKCPFCGYVFSRRGYKRHLMETHYDELLKIIDEYYERKS